MTINITILDDFKNELQIGDVVAVEYRSPLHKYIGVLQFSEEDKQLIISDLDGGWHAFPKADWMTIRLLGRDVDTAQLEKYFGRIEFTSRKKMNVFMQNLDELIEDLTIKIFTGE